MGIWDWFRGLNIDQWKIYDDQWDFEDRHEISGFEHSNHSTTGWWFQPAPLKKIRVNVSWDDEIPNCFSKNKVHVPNHLPDQCDLHGSKNARHWYPNLPLKNICIAFWKATKNASVELPTCR